MKKAALIIIAGITVLSAVEWNVEQVTHCVDSLCEKPVLVLDGAGRALILYMEYDDVAHLKVAVDDTDSWWIRGVTEGAECYTYSIDVSADGKTYVAYSDSYDEYMNIFLACDSSGEFEAKNLTLEEALQFGPVIKIDRQGVPHICFVELTFPDTAMTLHHGWIDGETFQTDLASLDMHKGDYRGHDFVFNYQDVPHAFYVGPDGYLWHAYPDEPPAQWIAEQLNEILTNWPSAVADPMGSFHVVYDADWKSIHYATNMSGAWQDETVCENSMYAWVERPALVLEKVWGGYLGIGNPHMVWMSANTDEYLDLWYAGKRDGSWVQEPVTQTPELSEFSGFGHYFQIDFQGYGHLAFASQDAEGVGQIFYAKSEEPLFGVGAAEIPVRSEPLDLNVKGSLICFNLEHSSNLTLSLYDISGRAVERLASGFYSTGEHSIPLNTSGLSAGVYFVRAEIGGQSSGAKLVVTR